MRGRWHGGAVTDEVGHFHLCGAVRLIRRLRRQLPLIGEAFAPQEGNIRLVLHRTFY